MSGGISLCTSTSASRASVGLDVQRNQSIDLLDASLECTINVQERAEVRAEGAPTVRLPMINYITQAELFPRPAPSDDEREFRSILQTVLPEKAPAIVSIINNIERRENSFLVEGLMWDGTVVSIELVGRYRRGLKADLRWYARPDEIQFGWEPGSKRWLRHAGDLRVVNTNRCNFQRIDIAA
ncbi:hypothetical protein FV226_11585 [Methylobacterium sp. WL12]|uniref:hypothetical protein n=1 Tax=unclassified Methylobacterium TaxID=2615210 RepID=UPI0011C855B5|nr:MULTISPECIES: hypothetical protein [unclassified Methylobacterium]TXM70672.1 hypothetical protein FV229_01500 [Methylobacterium sp. WL120]TXM72659.1 hypothetical protein FV226_11585 [Methylobacterium sp. WL12]